MSEPDKWEHVWERHWPEDAVTCQGCGHEPWETEASEPCPQVFNRRQTTGRGPGQ